MNKHWIIEPRHGFFAKDARGWFAGMSNQGHSLPWLLPTTLRGAICSAIGRELESIRKCIFSPREWLDLKATIRLRRALTLRAAVGHGFNIDSRMWPAPADAVFLPQSAAPVRLVASARQVRFWDRAGSDSGADDGTGGLELMTFPAHTAGTSVKALRGPAWWTESEFVQWLCGKDNAGPTSGFSSRQTHSRYDVHVKMNNLTDTAESGFLWTNDFRETLTRDSNVVHRWAVASTFTLENTATHVVQPTTATIAGDRHFASVLTSAPLDLLPPALSTSRDTAKLSNRLRVYAVTPTVFQHGWCPDGFHRQGNSLVGELPSLNRGVRLVSALVQRPQPISGWDLACDTVPGFATEDSAVGNSSGYPRETRLACPPGSMWLLESLDQLPFTSEDVAALWLSSWGQGNEDGLGVCVAGIDVKV